MVKLVLVLAIVLAVSAREVPIKLTFCGGQTEAQDTINAHVSILYGKALKVHGVSASLFGVSTVVEEMHGIQSGCIAALAYGKFVGYQVSGFVSYAQHDVTGLQASGLLSRTIGNIRGGQTGFINIAHKVSGFQFGFINISDTLNGVPLGIINIAENGNVRLIAYGTSVAARNIGAQFLVNNWCSSIGISNGYLHKEPYDDIALTTSFGYRFPIGRHGIVLDGASVIMQRGLNDYDSDNHEWLEANVLLSNQLRVYGDVQILKNLSLFAGGGLAVSYNPNTSEKINRDNFDPMFMAGITLF